MLHLQQLKQNLAASIVPLFCACFVVYLGYHGLYGDHGLITMLRLNTEIESLEFELAAKRSNCLVGLELGPFGSAGAGVFL